MFENNQFDIASSTVIFSVCRLLTAPRIIEELFQQGFANFVPLGQRFC